ncbi:hypothetical protein HYFRA_00003068 [Hymenoscyphus fraxineus]|uniref:Uncharacterized protein n=1 Tax=Hymenoscyphus fraxineus TaxID=746836 RepID=A0A9N9KPP6_9HELO|nr:hypothetical protein HYFRA_00003068 [Hymenoscyphus fraxineus]
MSKRPLDDSDDGGDIESKRTKLVGGIGEIDLDQRPASRGPANPVFFCAPWHDVSFWNIAPGPTSDGSPEEDMIVDQVAEYQKTNLKGFSISMLDDLGAWRLDPPRKNNLTCPIHPLYRKENWYQEKPFQIVPGSENNYFGDWDVHNPLVWKAIEPVLRLATHLLLSAQFSGVWQWLDGLLHGPRDHIPQTEIDTRQAPKCAASDGNYVFHRSDKSNFEKAQNDIANTIANYRHDIKVSFGNESNLKSAWAYVGKVQDPGQPERVETTMYLNALAVRNLIMMPDIRESQKMVQRFFLAAHLVHETMHALGASAHARRPDLRSLDDGGPPEFREYDNQEGSMRSEGKSWEPEPFFEDQETSELGRSWEHTQFGGARLPLYTGDQELILGHVIGPRYPNWTDYYYMPRYISMRWRKPENFEAGSHADYFPIPTKYQEDMQQETFWQAYVPAIGQPAFRIPLIWGVRITRPAGEIPASQGSITPQSIAGPDLKEYNVGAAARLPRPPGPVTKELKNWWNQNNRRSRESAVKAVLRNNQIEKRDARWASLDERLDEAIEALRRNDEKGAAEAIQKVEKCDNTRINIRRGMLIYGFYKRYPSSTHFSKATAMEEGVVAEKSFRDWVDDEVMFDEDVEKTNVNPNNPPFLDPSERVDKIYQQVVTIFETTGLLNVIELDSRDITKLNKEEKKEWKKKIREWIAVNVEAGYLLRSQEPTNTTGEAGEEEEEEEEDDFRNI